MQNHRLKQQQQALMQQALLQQQSLYHPGLLAPPQIEPIPSGNLPPGFDPSTCCSVYVGNIHTQVTEPLLQEVFAGTGPVEGCKLIRKEKSSYGFIHYFYRRSAAFAILYLNGRHLFGQPIKVNWAYASGQREDTSAPCREESSRDANKVKIVSAPSPNESGSCLQAFNEWRTESKPPSKPPGNIRI